MISSVGDFLLDAGNSLLIILDLSGKLGEECLGEDLFLRALEIKMDTVTKRNKK